MYDETFQLHQLQSEEEDLDDEDRFHLWTLAATTLVVGEQEARRATAAKRAPHRAYLRRPHLLPDPREGTPWQRLYASQSDDAFIVTMGLNVEAFNLILAAGFEEKWNTHAIPRNDVPSTAIPRPERRSLDAAGALGLVLHYLTSTMREISLQQIFALIPSTVSRYIDFALEILHETLQKMRQCFILWPKSNTVTDDFQDLANLVARKHHLLTGAFGTMDGLKLPCQTSDDEEIENATFNGWLHEHFVNSVLVFSPRGVIIAANLNCPGSWHDSRVAQPIYEKLRTRTPDGYYLVADTAFPRGTQQVMEHIRAPMKQGHALSSDPDVRAHELAFDRQLLSYRQSAEWGMRAMQGSFGRLRVPLEIAHHHRRARLLETCVRLHNLRTNIVGINQIRSVYMPLWEGAETEGIWDGFRDILFSEQRRQDRVSSFHGMVQHE